MAVNFQPPRFQFRVDPFSVSSRIGRGGPFGTGPLTKQDAFGNTMAVMEAGRSPRANQNIMAQPGYKPPKFEPQKIGPKASTGKPPKNPSRVNNPIDQGLLDENKVMTPEGFNQSKPQGMDPQGSAIYADWYSHVYQPLLEAGYPVGSIPRPFSAEARRILQKGGYAGGPILGYLEEQEDAAGGLEDLQAQIDDLLATVQGGTTEVASESPSSTGGSALNPYFNPYGYEDIE